MKFVLTYHRPPLFKRPVIQFGEWSTNWKLVIGDWTSDVRVSTRLKGFDVLQWNWRDGSLWTIRCPDDFESGMEIQRDEITAARARVIARNHGWFTKEWRLSEGSTGESTFQSVDSPSTIVFSQAEMVFAEVKKQGWTLVGTTQESHDAFASCICAIACDSARSVTESRGGGQG